jgi:phage-related protein (TIGR01555 family)
VAKRAASAHPAHPPHVPMKVSPRAVVASHPRDTSPPVWETAEPPPGVAPTGFRLANDDQLQGLYGFAGASPFLASGGSGQGFYAFLGFPYLAALMQQSEYRRGVETLAREMTRKWIKLTYSGKTQNEQKLQQLEKALRKFKVREVFRRAAELDGGFGRAHIYIDTGVSIEDRELPLVLDKRVLRKGGLKAIRAVDPTWCYPAVYNSDDPLADDFYRPNIWYVLGKKVHATRLLPLIGREVPDLLKPAYSFGGVSLTQMAKPTVDNFTANRESVSRMLRSFSTMVLSTDMSAALNGGTGADLANRVAMYNNYRDNSGCFVVNAETATGNGVGEKLENVSAPLSGLDKLLDQSREQMAAIYGQPLVIMFGMTPGGLNATSEGEIRVWYDFVRAYQEHLFDAPLSRVLEAVQLHEFGGVDPDIGFEYEPLWQLDEAAQASVEKTKAETHDLYCNSIGAVGPDEVRESVAADESGPYAGLDLKGPAPGPPVDPMGAPDADGGEAEPEPADEQRDGT